MLTFAQKPEATTRAISAKSALRDWSHFGRSREVNSAAHPQRTVGNRAAQRTLESNAEALEAGLDGAASPRFAHDFSQVRARATSPTRVQAKLIVNPDGDSYEQEADEVSERVMRMPESQPRRACPCGGGCPGCRTGQPGRESVQTKRVRAGDTGQIAAPPVVHEVLASPGQPLDRATRAFMEPRFGHDFGHVRVHADERAAESARALGALAYTVGSEIVFSRGQYAPGTQAGKRLLAHELSHVEQQRELAAAHADNPPVVQRICDVSKEPTGNAIASQVEADYLKAVREGKYCKDTGATGAVHEGRCYREIPPGRGFPPGDQVCFDEKTGECAEDSPDVVSAVEGQHADGSCNLGAARSAGHGAEDFLPSEPVIVGAGLGALSGSGIGYASGLGPYRLLGVGTGFVFGAGLGAALGKGSGPLARRLSRRGYVPTVGVSAGIANPVPNLAGDATWQARLYVGAAKRDRPLLNVLYPELKLGVTLMGEQDTEGAGGATVGPSAITSLVAGIRIDPGQPGGHYVSVFGGPALAVSSGGTAVGAEARLSFGHRWRWVGYSADIGYIHDPTRGAGMGNQLTLGLGVELGPDKPPPREKARHLPTGGMLSQEVVEGIRRALDAQVSPGALMPSEMRVRLAEAREAAEKAGPFEEASLSEARKAVEDEAGEYMNAHDVAFDLAVLMDKARRSGSPYVKLEFEHYGKAGVHGGPLRKFVAGEIRRIALILRNYLPDQAAGVNTILVNFRFEQAVVQEEIRLPGWVAP